MYGNGLLMRKKDMTVCSRWDSGAKRVAAGCERRPAAKVWLQRLTACLSGHLGSKATQIMAPSPCFLLAKRS